MGVEIQYQAVLIDILFNGSDSTIFVTDKMVMKWKKNEAKFIIDSSGYGRGILRLLNLNIPYSMPAIMTLFSNFKEYKLQLYTNHKKERKNYTVLKLTII